MIIDLYSIAQKIPELIINIMLTFVTKKTKNRQLFKYFRFILHVGPNCMEEKIHA